MDSDTHMFVAMVFRSWDTIDVKSPLMALPVDRSSLPGAGYLPVYESAEEARKEHGEGVELVAIQRQESRR